MENNIEVRTDAGLRATCWLTATAAAQGPETDPFDTVLAGQSGPNPFKDQKSDFFQDLFDGMVQQFGEKQSTQASPGDRTLTEGEANNPHAPLAIASGKAEGSGNVTETVNTEGKTVRELDAAASVDDVDRAAGKIAGQKKTAVKLCKNRINSKTDVSYIAKHYNLKSERIKKIKDNVQNNSLNSVNPFGSESIRGSMVGNDNGGLLNYKAHATNDGKVGTLKSGVEGSVMHAGLNGRNGFFSGGADVYHWRGKAEGGITNYANISSSLKANAFEGEIYGQIDLFGYFLKGTLNGSAGGLGYEAKLGKNGVKLAVHVVLGGGVGFEWGSTANK
jgi:hypothetical protein